MTCVAAEASEERSAQDILDSYVTDFRSDPAADRAITFGVRVTGQGGGDWHVVVSGKKSAETGDRDVTLASGFPKEPCVFYKVDLPTLRKIDSGKLNALTAMAAAFTTDVTPMDIDATDGFAPPSEDFFTKEFVPFTFHFWTRGLPEIVPFGSDLTRKTHGANVTVFYYEKGLRTAWGEVRKGEHVNADPQSQTNPFPSMLIVLSGKLDARLGGKAVSLEKGQMAFIPPGMTHEFWNNHDEAVQVILLMFGEGA